MQKENRKQTNEVADDLLMQLAKPNLKPTLKSEIIALTKVSDALQHLGEKTCQRVLKWAENRFINTGDSNG